MGLDSRIIRVLDHARAGGVDFDRTAMIGRQQLHLSTGDFRAIAAQCGLHDIDRLTAEIFDRGDRYAEPLLHAMGASQVDSVDVSEYEGANIIADMNQPVSGDLHQRYSLVIDGGSLEHIFFFPTAIKNCMQMVEVGGHFFTINGTNNFSGHGFYQFSPELMYRVLSPENGFEVTEMLMWERTKGSTVYRVKDPKDVGGRVMAQTNRETFLTVIAKRTHDTEIFATTPMQSDYVVDWKSGEHRPPAVHDKPQPTLKRIGKQAERKVREVRRLLFSRYHPEHYEPLQWRRSA
jgi:hypothetical protein